MISPVSALRATYTDRLPHANSPETGNDQRAGLSHAVGSCGSRADQANLLLFGSQSRATISAVEVPLLARRWSRERCIESCVEAM